MGLDANKWFGNVEIAAASVVGRESVDYVSNIYKYYFAHTLITEKGKNQNRQVRGTGA